MARPPEVRDNKPVNHPGGPIVTTRSSGSDFAPAAPVKALIATTAGAPLAAKFTATGAITTTAQAGTQQVHDVVLFSDEVMGAQVVDPTAVVFSDRRV